ncbi:MAG: hypothetical protein R6U28_10820 [Cyclonatronaceae bacterium]
METPTEAATNTRKDHPVGRTHLVGKLIEAGQRDYTQLDLSDMAQITRTPLDEISSHFRDVDEWIDAFYCMLVEQYRDMTLAIPDFEQYTVGEKLLNFSLSSMDMMGDHEHLVRSTFHPFILDRFTSTRFEHSVAALFREFTDQDERIAMSNQLFLVSPVYTWWSREYLHLIGYWLEKPGSEPELMALAEKTTTLLNEILYNGVFDKTLDLGKYLVENGFVTPRAPLSILRRLLRF